MDAREMMQWISTYYGAYPNDLPGKAHALAVAEWLSTRGPRYLEALKQVLTDKRTFKYGPPARSDLKELHTEVMEMVAHPPVERVMKDLLRIEGPDDRLATQNEVLAFWESVRQKLRDKERAREGAGKGLERASAVSAVE